MSNRKHDLSLTTESFEKAGLTSGMGAAICAGAGMTLLAFLGGLVDLFIPGLAVALFVGMVAGFFLGLGIPVFIEVRSWVRLHRLLDDVALQAGRIPAD